MADVKISIHCWQGDDVKGFLTPQGELTGGIMSTGNYPYAAHTPDELRRIWRKLTLSFLEHKLNLHAMYLDTDEEVDLNQIEPKHFTKWVEWAKNKVLA